MRALLLPALGLAAVSPLCAQDIPPDSLPFRRGQWAVQFVGSLGAAVGVLKFRSPASAWVVLPSVSGSHSESFDADTITGIVSAATVNVRFGLRTHRRLGSRVVGYHTVGVQLGLDHRVQASPVFGSSSSNGLDAGPYVDVGSTYRVTTYLGIGVNAAASIRYGRGWSENFSGEKGSSWTLSGSTGIGLHGMIVF